MRNRFLAFTLIATVVGYSAPALADYTAISALALHSMSDVYSSEVNAFVYGAAQSLGWANARLANHNLPELFCVRGDLALTQSQNWDILKRFVDGNPRHGDNRVAYVLLLALEETFPCPKQK